MHNNDGGLVTVERWSGREARLLRTALRMSVRGFAEHLGVAVRTVSRWEQLAEDRAPRPEYQAVLDTALRQADSSVQERFQLLLRAQEPLPEAAAASEASVPPAASIDRDALFAYLVDQWHLLVRTDNLFGPRHALTGVLHQLRIIDGLLATADESMRADLIRLAAQYAESASWLHEDSNLSDPAKAWNRRAMEWAQEADDGRMLAWTLFRSSQQAVQQGNGAAVVGLAKAAGRDAANLPTTMRAAIAQQVAFGLALSGDEVQTHVQLDDARGWAAADTSGDARAGHGSFCTEEYIELQRAACWLTLGQPQRAIGVYETALPRLPGVYRRDRGRALGRLAAAYAADNQPDQAATTALDALSIARDTGSAITTAQVHAVARSLRSYNRLPAVAELSDQVARSTG